MAKFLQRPLALSMLCAVLSFVTPIAAQAQGVSFIEGYVFNTHTGVPLQSAEITLRVLVIPAQELRTFTDSNGFYIFNEVSTELEILIISAICRTPKGTAISGRARPIRLREGTIRRDLYIDADRGRLFSQCGVVLIPGT